jgi:ribosomal RNA-processing protein 36
LVHLQVEEEWKTSEKSKLEAGKQPFYLKASEKKKRILEKKFARLEETGQLEKYMAKKRKRQASKMHKKLPDRR